MNEEKLPPPPKTIIITRTVSKMIDITNMDEAELDKLLHTEPPKPVIDMISFFFLP